MCFCFDPVVGSSTDKMIFGTFPGPASLEKQEYYADFAHNDFWKLALNLQDPGKIPYQKRLQLLRDRRIGLWDIYRLCEREGADDDAIDVARSVPNDFFMLKIVAPNLSRVYFNGKLGGAADRYRNTFESLGYKVDVLLSSSNALAGRREERLEQWKAAFW